MNANDICYVDMDEMPMDNLDMVCNDDTEEKCILIDISVEEQYFRFTYKSPRAKNGAEHRKYSKLA